MYYGAGYVELTLINESTHYVFFKENGELIRITDIPLDLEYFSNVLELIGDDLNPDKTILYWDKNDGEVVLRMDMGE